MGAQKAAYYKGKCSGHGTARPCNIYDTKPCGTPCSGSTPMALSTSDATNRWPPQAQRPKTPKNPTVLINNICPIIDKDVLTNHKGATTNLLAFCCCKKPPPPKPCHTRYNTFEDKRDGGKHKRVSHATTKTVYIMGKLANRFDDPLNGGISGECYSTIAGASPNVFIGN